MQAQDQNIQFNISPSQRGKLLSLLLRSALDRASAEVQALFAQSLPACARVWLLTCSDFVKGDGLGHSPPQCHTHPLQQLFLGEEVLLSWKDLSKSKSCVCSRGYGNLQYRAAPSVQRTKELPTTTAEGKEEEACIPKEIVKSFGAG